MAGVVPFVGGLLLTGIFIKAFIDYNKVENTYAGKFLGFGVPVAIGVGLLVRRRGGLGDRQLRLSAVLQEEARDG